MEDHVPALSTPHGQDGRLRASTSSSSRTWSSGQLSFLSVPKSATKDPILPPSSILARHTQPLSATTTSNLRDDTRARW